MQNIGERLEEARKRKGISIREAAEATKIRGDYLQKFEANSFEIDLPPLYLRGFVRTYARYLELDADKLLQDFNTSGSSDSKPARRESREVYGRVDFNESPAKESEPAQAAEPARPAAPTPIDQAVLLKYGIFGVGALIFILVILLLVNMLSRSDSDAPSRAQPAGTGSTPTVQADPIQTVTFTATEPTRLKIVQDLDSRELFNGALARGETRTFQKQGRLLITVEDKSKLRMEVNGRRYDFPAFQGGGTYGRFALD